MTPENQKLFDCIQAQMRDISATRPEEKDRVVSYVRRVQREEAFLIASYNFPPQPIDGPPWERFDGRDPFALTPRKLERSLRSLIRWVPKAVVSEAVGTLASLRLSDDGRSLVRANTDTPREDVVAHAAESGEAWDEIEIRPYMEMRP